MRELYNKFGKWLAEEKERRQQDVADGKVEDWAEYKRVCGTIQGLILAEHELQDLFKRLSQGDDE